jgi:hypothetical protein
MGKALEVITGFVTAPSTTLTALTMAAGNSLTLRQSSGPDKKILLIETWARNQAAGVYRIRSPKMHDFVQGIRKRVTTADVFPLLGIGQPQRCYSQDILTVELSGSAVGGQIESAQLLIFYEDMLGVDAHLIDQTELHRRAVNIEPIEVVNAAGAAGGYSGEVALNSSFDTMKANTEYACIGGMVDTVCCGIGIRGSDTGNLRVAVPGLMTLRHMSADWFLRLADELSMPLIPVFNSANKGSILCDVVQNQGGASVNTTWNLVELSPNK